MVQKNTKNNKNQDLTKARKVGYVAGRLSAKKVQDRQAKKIKERMHQQEMLAFLSQLALATSDFDLFGREVVRSLAHVLDADYAKLLEVDETDGYLILRAGYGWKGVKPGITRMKASSTLAEYSLLTKRPIIVSHLDTDKRFSKLPLLAAHKAVSGMSVIIPGLKKPYGAIGVYTKRHRVFTDDDLNLLQSVANIVALASQRTLTESELRRFQYMADNANVGISLIDEDGKFKYVNKITYERLGFDKQEYMNRRVVHRLTEKSEPQFGKTFRLAQKNPLPSVESYEMKKDGHNKVPLEINITGVRFEGKPYLFAVSQDITDRKKSQSNLEFLAKASYILGSSLNYGETLSAVADAAVLHIADWCSVDIVNAGGGVDLLAVGHKDPKRAEWARKLRKMQPLDLSERNGVAGVLRTGKAELYPVIDDRMLRTVARSPERYENMQKILKKLGGMKSVMIVPIKTGKKILGAITFINTETQRNYDENDLAIAIELASRTSLAIENSKLYSELEDQKTRLNTIIGNVPGVVWEMWADQNHAEQRINFVSDYIEKMVGYRPDEWLIPGFWFSAVHPEDRERAREEQRLMLSSGQPIVQRFRWIHKNGSVLWVESHVSVIVGAKGNPVGLRGVTMDVSERIGLEKRKDEFISMASHELKTPVTTLKVFTQILQKQAENDADASFKTYLMKMDLQITRLTDLINDLLDLSKIQTGKLSFKLSEFNMSELVGEIVEQLQPTTDHHKIIVRGAIKRKVSGDRDRVSQVLINLITNAIKYSPNADKIILHLSDTRDSVSVAVEDFGIGVAKEQQKLIFDRFYQGNDKDERTFPGLGIGLYISNEIMRRHGGTISVVSTKGKGSLFKMTLPLKIPQEAHTGIHVI